LSGDVSDLDYTGRGDADRNPAVIGPDRDRYRPVWRRYLFYGDVRIGNKARALEVTHKVMVLFRVLGNAGDCHMLALVHLAQGPGVRLFFSVEAGNGVAVRTGSGTAEDSEQVALDDRRNRVLHPVRFFVSVGPLDLEDIDQQPFCQHVTPDDRPGGREPFIGELDTAAVLQMHEAVSLHPSQGRQGSRRRYPEAFFYPGEDRRLVLATHRQDRLKVVFNCVRVLQRLLVHPLIVGGLPGGRQPENGGQLA
jgi:hypothetical protein